MRRTVTSSPCGSATATTVPARSPTTRPSATGPRRFRRAGSRTSGCSATAPSTTSSRATRSPAARARPSTTDRSTITNGLRDLDGHLRRARRLGGQPGDQVPRQRAARPARGERAGTLPAPGLQPVRHDGGPLRRAGRERRDGRRAHFRAMCAQRGDGCPVRQHHTFPGLYDALGRYWFAAVGLSL